MMFGSAEYVDTMAELIPAAYANYDPVFATVFVIGNAIGLGIFALLGATL